MAPNQAPAPIIHLKEPALRISSFVPDPFLEQTEPRKATSSHFAASSGFIFFRARNTTDVKYMKNVLTGIEIKI